MQSWLWENSGPLADLATVLGATVAGFALIFAWGQIRAQQLSGRETTARGLYQDYMKLALENPVLASPEFSQFDHKAKTIKSSDLSGDARLLYDRYEWFVGLLLDAGEEILRLRPTKEWVTTIERQLAEHVEYLEHHFARYADEYEDPICDLVERVVSRHRVRQPV